MCKLFLKVVRSLIVTKKRRKMKKNGLIFMLALVFASVLSSLANPVQPEGKSNYVVIGAFAVREHAAIWVETAKKLDLEAQFDLNPTRKLYYVYVLETTDWDLAVFEAKKLRSRSQFNDTWVFTGTLGDNQATAGVDKNPETEKELVMLPAREAGPEENKEVAEVKVEAPRQDPGIGEKAPVENKVEPAGVVANNEKREEESGGKGFIFKVTFEGKPMTGDVDLVDGTRLTKVASYETNKRIYLKPVNTTGKVEARCQIFGYRKAQVNFNYNQPETTEGVTIEDGNVVIPFDLVKLKKGDFAIMYNVFFYKDAAIMRPESQYEVKTLLTMLNENPRLKIRLHGHTNGGSAGKILEVGESKNFFSLSGAKEGFGSAKALSEERAGVIRQYLMAEGIDGSRVEVKAWGGKKPIHDKKSNKAHENVRVEVEILED